MKKTNSIKILLLTLTVSLSLGLNSCKKGETGPKGDPGMPGSTGATGEAGPSAKSYKFDLQLSSFTGPLTEGEYSQPSSLSFMNGNFISENDAVLVYLKTSKTGSTDYYTQLPFNDYFNTGTAFNEHYFEVGSTGSANIVVFKIRNSTGVQPYQPMIGTLSYKLVLIKGSANRKANLPTDLSYNSIKQRYNLSE